MRRAGSLLLALCATLACGGATTASTQPTPPPVNKCNIGGTLRIFVEVVKDGRVIATDCAGFSQSSVDALTVMRHGGLEFATQTSSFGTEICQVDHIPASYSQCLPQSAPYWADWIWSGGRWQMAQAAPEKTLLSAHEALGWVYTPQTGSPAPPPSPPPS
jgi:hypothetical protein